MGVLNDDGVFLVLYFSFKIVSLINLTDVLPKEPVIPKTFSPLSFLGSLFFLELEDKNQD